MLKLHLYKNNLQVVKENYLPFVLKEYSVTIGKKIQIALLQDVSLSISFSQRMLSRGRIFDSKQKAYKNGDVLKEPSIFIAQFEGHTRGLKPLLTFEDFALFDKPSNLMIHPNSKKTAYSLLDEIRYHFGEDANQIHRIDAETSGLLLVGLHDKAINELGAMFENKAYKKSYIALVEGEINKEITIDSSLEKEGKNIGVRMKAGETGKKSLTIIKPICYDKTKDISLVEALPITGRQHQIRVHLYSIGHRIVGDPVYGVEDEYVEGYLNKSLDEKVREQVTGSHRLWLHANYLEFNYKNRIYKIYSKNRDIYEAYGK